MVWISGNETQSNPIMEGNVADRDDGDFAYNGLCGGCNVNAPEYPSVIYHRVSV
jgi:hypothetical protein